MRHTSRCPSVARATQSRVQYIYLCSSSWWWRIDDTEHARGSFLTCSHLAFYLCRCVPSIPLSLFHAVPFPWMQNGGDAAESAPKSPFRTAEHLHHSQSMISRSEGRQPHQTAYQYHVGEAKPRTIGPTLLYNPTIIIHPQHKISFHKLPGRRSFLSHTCAFASMLDVPARWTTRV